MIINFIPGIISLNMVIINLILVIINLILVIINLILVMTNIGVRSVRTFKPINLCNIRQPGDDDHYDYNDDGIKRMVVMLDFAVWGV